MLGLGLNIGMGLGIGGSSRSPLRLWYDASDASTIILNGADVSEWKDKSGNGAHLTQTTASKQPLYSIASHNGLNGILFDRDATQVLANASVGAINQPLTVFCIIENPFVLSAPHVILSSTLPSAGLFIWVRNNVLAMLATDEAISSAIGSSLLLVTSVFDGASSEVYFDRISKSLSISPGTNAISGLLEVGLRTAAGNTGFDGFINEIKVFDQILSSAARIAVWDEILPKWGIE